MKELSEKTYWNNVHRERSVMIRNLIHIPLIQHFLLWFQNWDFYRICRKYFQPSYKEVFEVGCAPWNYLLQFSKLFGFRPSGVEYTSEWVKATQKNLAGTGIESDIIFWDFFDKDFLQSHREQYDVVYSMGFIEHFDDPTEAIRNHFLLTKKGGLVICTLPNLYYWNKYFVPKDILDIHNLNIMRIDEIKKYFQEGEILEAKYYGGTINFWAYAYRNKALEGLRMILFILQRLFLDPLLMILRLCGIDFSNRFLSPAIVVVCRKVR